MKVARNFWIDRISSGVVATLLIFTMPSFAQMKTMGTVAPQNVIAESVPSNPTPLPNETITVAVNVDVSGLPAPDNRLGAYQAALEWDPAFIQYLSITPAPAPWNNPILLNITANKLEWRAFAQGGSTGKINILNINFKVVSAASGSTTPMLSFSNMTTAIFFTNLLNKLTVQNNPITVRVNAPPVLAAIANQTMNEGLTLAVPISATDPDSHAIQLRVNNLPSLGGFTDNTNGTGTILFSPNFDAANVYSNIQVIAIDNGTPAKSDTASFTLTVLNVNRAPQFPPLGFDAVTLNEGDSAQLEFTVDDPDSGRITFIVQNLPSFGNFVDNQNGAGTMTLAPGFDAAGVYPPIRLIAIDDGTPALSDTVAFTLTVKNVNRPPLITPLPPSATINEGGKVDFLLIAIDSDGDKIGLSGKNLPTFASVIDSGNGKGILRLAPGRNDAGNYPNILIIATDNGAPNLSDSTRIDLLVLNTLSALACTTQIISPQNGTVTCANSIEVCIATRVSGSVGTIKKICEVNGIPVADSCATIPLRNGSNTIIAKCVITDSLDSCEASDTIAVVFNPLISNLKITAPLDSAFICAASVNVIGNFSLTGGTPPIQTVCTINGDTVVASGNSFSGTLQLNPGFNKIITTCRFVDALGCNAVVSDTVTAFSDPTPPLCTIDFSNPANITGEIVDDESGIAKVEAINVNNRIVTIDPFTEGDKLVRFSSTKIDPRQTSGFILRITNRAGCTVECDPVLLRLDPVQTPSFTFTVPHTDRYFYVNNHGLRRIAVTLNQHAFELVADEHQRDVEGRLYVMPLHGARTIDLAAFMVQGENSVTLTCEGPPNSEADIILADFKIDEHSGMGETIPQNFALMQNYPNPFSSEARSRLAGNPSTTIRFQVPAGDPQSVILRVFNLQGQLVTTLVDGIYRPGTHSAAWDGKDSQGISVASGIYLYQLQAGRTVLVKRMMLTK